ncbi:MAG TPA: CPBP family intramembrane glutamic endopeptidase [Bryobacteraceae bacterium]|nr:CPBP family intramembrane glutamic endopeptidase [Bryobacteraceae bacterium]
MRDAFGAPFWNYEDLALFIGSIIPCGFAGAVLVRALHVQNEAGRTLLFQALIYALLFASLYILISWKHGQPFWRSLSWRHPVRFPVSWVVGGLLLAIAMAMLAGALGAKPVPDPIRALISGRWSLAAVMLFVVVLGPAFEELVFRGFLLPLLVKTFGPAGGILLTALPFALLHGSQNQWAWQQITVIGIAGAAFGYAKYKTGSTAASTLLHSGFNLVGAIAYVFQWEHGAL